MRLLARTLLVVTAISPTDTSAQQLTAGDMIHVRPSAATQTVRQWGDIPRAPTWTAATVVRLANDTLWYRVGRAVTQVSVAEAEVRRPSGRDHRWVVASVAGVAGATALGLIAYSNFEPEYGYSSISAALVCSINACGRPPQMNSLAGDVAGMAFVGAVMGSLVGYVVGKSLGRWESVALMPTFANDGGPSMSLRVGF